MKDEAWKPTEDHIVIRETSPGGVSSLLEKKIEDQIGDESQTKRSEVAELGRRLRH